MEASSTGLLWAGRVLSGIAIAFLLFDASGKLMKVAPVVEGSAKLGFPESAVLPIGVLLLTGVVLYAIPRTSCCSPSTSPRSCGVASSSERPGSWRS